MKPTLNIFWIMNILAVTYFLIPFFFFHDNYEQVSEIMFLSAGGIVVYYSLAICGILLWIYCLNNHSKVSKSTMHLVLLIFFNSVYLIFYYYYFYMRKSGILKKN